MRSLVLALSLCAPAWAAGVKVAEIHAENLAFLAAMPAGGPALPVATGKPLAGLSVSELERAYNSVALSPALAYRGIPPLPASKIAAAAEPVPSAAPLEAAPARGPPGALRAEPFAPQPAVEKLERWFAGTDPASSLAWAFDGVDPALKRELEERAGSDPAAFLRARYEMEGAVYEVFDDLPQLVTAWRSRGAVPEQLRAVLDDSFMTGGVVRSVITPRVWSRLMPAQKAAVAQGLAAGPIRQGARLSVWIAGADPDALARKYAMGRDPEPLARALRAELAAGKASVPLESLLPERIRGRVGTFADCTGPNCVNAVMSETPYYDDATTLVADLKATHRRMPDGEPVLAGDKLVYTDMSKQLVHVAESVGDGYVFTKNGLGRQYPYLFQRQAAMEAVHFPAGQFRLIVFRP